MLLSFIPCDKCGPVRVSSELESFVHLLSMTSQRDCKRFMAEARHINCCYWCVMFLSFNSTTYLNFICKSSLLICDQRRYPLSCPRLSSRIWLVLPALAVGCLGQKAAGRRWIPLLYDHSATRCATRYNVIILATYNILLIIAFNVAPSV